MKVDEQKARKMTSAKYLYVNGEWLDY